MLRQLTQEAAEDNMFLTATLVAEVSHLRDEPRPELVGWFAISQGRVVEVLQEDHLTQG